jgi:hypothetical protein
MQRLKSRAARLALAPFSDSGCALPSTGISPPPLASSSLGNDMRHFTNSCPRFPIYNQSVRW